MVSPAIELPLRGTGQCIGLHSPSVGPRAWVVRTPTGSLDKCNNSFRRYGPSVGRSRRLVVRSNLGHIPDAVSSAAASVPSALDHLAAKLTVTLLTLGDVTEAASATVDAVSSAATDAAASVTSVAADAAASVTSAAADAAASVASAAANVTDAAATASTTQQEGGVFGFLAYGFEQFLKVLDNGLEKFHVPYSYGFAIILLTFIVKAATYPLSKKQVESTLATQALQPKVRDIQTRFKSDPEKMQVEVAKLYREAGVNPLAGCLPTLATIPIWIGLYKALSNVANEGLLTEGFFWIPSLAGPTTLAQQEAGGGLSWLFPLQNGAPPIGWAAAGAYLVMPILLVVSQYLSQKIISPQPQSEDPSQKQAQAILAALPFLIGWFSLNVPSGLTLYWFTNNLLTTAQQVWLRSQVQPAMAGNITSSGGTVVVPPKREEEPRITGKDKGSRRRKTEFDDDDDIIDVSPTSVTSVAPSPSGRGSRKGEKFREIKAREVARKKGKGQGDKFRQLKEQESSSKTSQHNVPISTQVQAEVDSNSSSVAAKGNGSE